MPAPLSQHHRCTLGTDAFQLTDVRFREDPIIVAGKRTGSRFSVEGVGHVAADDASSFATALGAQVSAFRVAGQDFRVHGAGNVEIITILAANCVNGGPFVSFEMRSGFETAALERTFTFKVSGDTSVEPAGGNDQPDRADPATIDTRPDALRVATWDGKLTGVNLDARFETLRDSFRSAFPAPTWVVSYRVAKNAAGNESTVQLSATELRKPLPTVDAENIVVDGEEQKRVGRDEQMRLTRVWEYDLLVKGVDYQPVVDMLRAAVQSAAGATTPILRENVDVTLIHELRVRATFETLAGGNGNPLLNWTQSIRVYPPKDVYEEIRFPAGVAPLLVKRGQGVGRIVQSGTAIGAGVWVKEPDPLLPTLLSEPEITYAEIDAVQRQTTWSYVMAYVEATDGPRGRIALDSLKRPGTLYVTT